MQRVGRPDERWEWDHRRRGRDAVGYYSCVVRSVRTECHDYMVRYLHAGDFPDVNSAPFYSSSWSAVRFPPLGGKRAALVVFWGPIRFT